METKLLYKDRIWEVISSHPKYKLGQRELAALIYFLPTAAIYMPKALNVLHLASATGREVPAVVNAIPGISSYLLNDIVPEVVERACQQMRVQFPQVDFFDIPADIELPGEVAKLRRYLSHQPALFVLAANGVIFSNRQMDSNVYQAMEKDDLFLLTVEKPHQAMFDSYLIKPVFELISESGRKVNADNIKVWYDNQAAEMHMACGGEDLLVSYKPTAEQLHERMLASGFTEIATGHYGDLHMLAGMYRRV